jgi:Domain of unknown function (DUF3859)
MRTVLACCLLAMTAASAYAQTAKLARIEVLSYGIYTGDESKCQRDAQGIKRCVRSNIRLAATTTTVPAQVGVQFGIAFRALGTPNGGTVNVKRIWKFPPAGLKSPASKAIIHRLDRDDRVTIGKVDLNTYIFDDPWELVPGTWTMEYWIGGRKILSRSFEVAKK